MAFDQELLNKKLIDIDISQSCIQKVSNFFFNYKENYITAISLWIKAVSGCQTYEKRLALLYVANEVLRNCVRKNVPEYLTEFQKYIIEVVKICAENKDIKSENCPHLRLFKIWRDRKQFPEDLLDEIDTICLNSLKNQLNDSSPEYTTQPLDPVREPCCTQDQLSTIFSKLDNPPSANLNSRGLISKLGEKFHDPSTLIKPLLEIIQKKTASKSDIEEFNAQYEQIIKHLVELEEVLNTYCSNVEDEKKTRTELSKMLEIMEKHLKYQEASFEELCYEKKKEIKEFDKLSHYSEKTLLKLQNKSSKSKITD